MEAQYTWVTVGKQKANDIMEIMGAPITEPSVFLEEISRMMGVSTTLCIGGELKTSDEGKPASNFRYEKDLELNGNCIENYIQLFQLHESIFHSKPIFVATIPRSWRLYSWLIQEDGMILRKDQEYRKNMGSPEVRGSMVAPLDETAQDVVDGNLMRFLSHNCIERDHLIKIRECCKGARYHTYLADMFSFLYQLRINSEEFSDTYYPEFRELDVIQEKDKPDRLVFEKTMGKGTVFMCPKKDSVKSIYQDFQEAISLDENSTKEKIRKHLRENTIHRWTDFSANDTDDAFTILMMIHAFNGIVGEKFTSEYGGSSSAVYYVPTEEENIIIEGLQNSLDDWRSQLEE